jgi:hypothetical protein
MSLPNLADRLRTLVDSLEPKPGIAPNDPDLLELKRILQAKIQALESVRTENQGLRIQSRV